MCSRHLCSLGSEAGASRRTAPKGQHEAQAVGRGRWGPAGCFGPVELGLFAEDLERPQEGEDTAGEVRLGRRVGPGQGRMEPQIPLLIFANGVPSLVPLAGAAVAGRLPPRDLLSVLLFPAHRRHLGAGPPRGGASHSAAPHSPGSPGAARQQVFVVEGTGRKRRAPTFC